MPKLSRFPFLICLLAPYVLTAAGCAQMGYAKRGKVQSEVCRSCHVPNGTAGAKDFGEIYAHPSFLPQNSWPRWTMIAKRISNLSGRQRSKTALTTR